jgi:serine/threonine protein kinase
MALRAGDRLGVYEIGSPLGASGMGEVYRARDTKLNRDVAVKILPTDVATDPDRLARFDREAQVLAALNHPNIAHIYGVEDSGSVHPSASSAWLPKSLELYDGDLFPRWRPGSIPTLKPDGSESKAHKATSRFGKN